ncbi:discoidin domain-containing protein [Flagellimonas sp. 389]|uniref:glycosyl hydrolase n=1 Tax=Flagellimonas sp. 389 TaxID=2835862 RepID=UPI001BD30AA1|nr:glycosyl hydrolase [Flagellimonas sp. 389]MBS9461857.1 discoidin domain-containing protein [Flagellimonas sp. 389]
MRNFIASFILPFILLLSCQTEKKETSNLEDEFKNPPEASRPRTWMHAMSGNMTKAGITKDLEAMAEVGLGGLLLFNITQGIPNGPIKYNSPEHHEMISHAAKEAQRLGLTFGVHNCDGWSASGGPWITPEESMKMVVWSETQVSGGDIELVLEKPTEREGFYRDIAVIAYPALESELDDATNTPTLTSSDKRLDISIVSDGKVDDVSELGAKNNKNPWLQFNYQYPKTIRSVKIVFNDRHAKAILQTSEDGTNFKDVRDLFKVRTGKGEWAINDHFEGITSKYFRLQFNQSIKLKEAQLTSTYFINNPLGRTSIARTEDHQLDAIGNANDGMIIAKEDIKDLSKNMTEAGILKATLPRGSWTILRFGYTSTGAFNNPASDEGRGLEVDKLSRAPFKKHYDAFIKKVVENAEGLAPNALKYAEIDSYEMGGQNWTEGFAEIFSNEKGYDFISKLPLVAGRFIESPEASEAVLYDYRQVITNLMTKNYFQYFTELCNADGLESYIEPYGFGPLNDLDVGGVTDIPMGEFWMNRPITQTASAVSSAHIYGKPVISAESFTSRPEINWKGHPAMAKTSGDLAWTYGINEFMFHRFAHQANTHAEPGMTMNRWGFHFDRTQTWWKNAGAAWFDYIARGSHMLRQGVPVSDMLVYVGEGTPNSSYYRTDFNPVIPKQINFDNVNTDVLRNRLKIENGELKLPEGTTYKILVLKNSETLSLPTLKRILEIAKSGVPIFGDRPKKLSGYQASAESKKQFEQLAKELAPLIGDIDDWKKVMNTAKLVPDMDILNGDAVDYVHRKTNEEDIYFFFNADTIGTKTFRTSFRVANKIPELWNPMDGSITKMAQFKNEGNNTVTDIELNTGESVFVVFREEASDIESIHTPVDDVLFKLSKENKLQATTATIGNYDVQLSSGKTWEVSIKDIPEPVDISKDWEVSFQEGHGYGGIVQFESLVDWSKHEIDSINYYSGTATYVKDFNLTKDHIEANTNVTLDLGTVHIAAEVIINGKKVAVSWMPPFQLDVTDFVHLGNNTLEIQLTNLWSNRLIGDERYPPNDGGYQLGQHRATSLTMPEWYTNNEPRPPGKRTTFTTAPFYKKDDPLVPSGLIGPVQIHFSKTITKSSN